MPEDPQFPAPPPGFLPAQAQSVTPPPPAGFLPARAAEAGAVPVEEDEPKGKTLAPPGPAKPPLPAGLQTNEQQAASGPVLRSRTGGLYQTTPKGSFPVLDAPATGISNIGEGIAQVAEPGLKEKAQGGSKIIRGLGEVAEPLAAAGLAVAPVGTLATFAATAAAQKGVQSSLKAAGVGPEFSEFAGDVAGLIAGAGGAGYLARKAYLAAGEPEVKFGGKFEEPKAFRDMSDAELVAHANDIDKSRPKNYEWQREEIAKEALRRQAGKGMSPGQGEAPSPNAPATIPQPPSGFSPVEETPSEPGEAPLPATVKKGQTFETPAGKVRVVSNASGQVVYQTTTPEGKKLAPAVLPADQFQVMVKPPEPPAGFTPVAEPAAPAAVVEPAVAAATAAPVIDMEREIKGLEMDLGQRPSIAQVQREFKLGYGTAKRALAATYPPPDATAAVAEPTTQVAPELKEETPEHGSMVALPEGDGAVSEPEDTRGASDVVDKPVRSGRMDLKVLDPVISAIPVDVVDMLGGKQRANEMLLHDPPVLAGLLSSRHAVKVSADIESLLPVIAGLRAELGAEGGPGAADPKYLSALDALDGHLREGLTGREGNPLPSPGQSETLPGTEDPDVPSAVGRTTQEVGSRNTGNAYANHADLGVLGTDPRTARALSTVKASRGVSGQHAALELGAMLATGQDTGLTREEAKAAFEAYYTHVVARHGRPMEGLLNYATDEVAGALKAQGHLAQEQQGGDSGTRDDRGTAGTGTPSNSGAEEKGGPIYRPGDGEGLVRKVGKLLSEETGTSNIVPRLKDLKDWAVKTFGPEDAPKLNYSGMGAKETKYVRNLGQTSKAAPGIIPAALRAASPKSQAGVIVATAHPLMRSVLAKSNMNLQDFYTWGVHDRLRGLEQRWRDFASQAQTMSDSDLENALDDGYYLGLLKAIEGKKDMADDVAEVATAISESKDWDVLRTYLDGMFTDAADQVATLMTPEEWKKAAADPNVQEALRIYKTRIEAPMRDDHAINEGVMSSALGQTNTYFPLMPVSADVKGGFGRSFPYRKPKNAFNNFATGLSEEYSTLPGDIRPRLMAGIRTNTKAALVKAAEESGLFKELKPGADRDIVTFEGVDYKASRPFVISDARTIVSNGKVVHVPAKQIVMPAWFEREMAPILEGNKWDLEGVNKVVNLLMKFTLSGPAEAAFHWANITGAIVANTPFLEDSFVGKALSLPLVKRVAAIGYVLSVDPTTDEASKQLVEMAQAGAVPSRFATETYSKRYAEELGAHRRLLTLAPALFGPEGFDIRARLLMWRLGKQINPDATPKEMNLFVNQMGNYVPQLQGELERSLKSTGFSPFYTAGSTMLRNGINAWTAQGPVPGGTTPRILGWKLMTGALGLIGTWIALHKGMTGKYPWEDKRAKFLALPVGGSNGVLNESLRRSALGRAMWGTGPETGYIGVNFFNPLVARGARALGISGAINTSFRGGSGSQQFEAAQRDMFNSLVHPIAGPPLRAAFVLGLGVEPQLSDFRDRRGQISPQFFRAIPQDAKPGLPTLGHKALSLLSLNSFYGNVGEATGLTNNPYRKGDLWLRAITDMSAPGLFGTASNPYKAETALRQQRKAH